MAKDVSTADTKSDEKKPVKKREKNTVPTKLVIRRLPPSLTEDELLEAIGPLPPHDYFRFASGDKSLIPENYCRAYINITSPDDILAFRDKVDGFELTDSKGNCQPCVLEYAPFQKNPRKTKKKEDTKVGTIEEDPDYIAFLESLQEEEEKTVIDLEKYLEELEKKEQKHKYVETPLTIFLKQKRDERKRIRDERRRLETDRRKKRDDERKRRDVERKKKIDAEKTRRKKDDDRKPRRDERTRDDEASDSKSTTQGKGDGKGLSKGKFEASSKTGPRLSDVKHKKPDNREPIRRGPIGSKPKDPPSENGEKERPYKGGYERGGYSGSRPNSRGRGYRPSSREFPTRKWDKTDDPSPRSRNKSWADDQDKKPEKKSSKRPDREIYKPGSSRPGTSPSISTPEGQSRPLKYSEQRTKARQDEEK